MPMRNGGNRTSCRANSRIDYGNVHGSFRKISICGFDCERSFENVVRPDIVRDIDQLNVWRNAEDDAFHDPDIGIEKAKVRRERYNHLMQRVYLDSNATTPMRPEVLAAMTSVFTEHFGNPSSIHWFGQNAKSLIDDARKRVAKLINAEISEIVFVSGGT